MGTTDMAKGISRRVSKVNAQMFKQWIISKQLGIIREGKGQYQLCQVLIHDEVPAQWHVLSTTKDDNVCTIPASLDKLFCAFLDDKFGPAKNSEYINGPD